MAEQKNELVEAPKQELTFTEKLTADLMENRGAIPTWLNTDRFIQNCLALMNGNDSLKEFASNYGTAQIRAGMLRAAYLGLDFMNKEAYLVPRKNQCVFQMDYRGAEKLAKKYSIHKIKEIYAKVVRQGDEFKTWSDDAGQHFEHYPKQFNDGAIVGAYAVVVYEDGTLQVDTMSKADIEKSRSKSTARNSMAWSDFYEEMCKKTVLHRLCKHIEIEFDNPQQTTLWNDDLSIDVEEDTKQGAYDVEDEAIDDGEEIPITVKEI